MIKLVEFIHGFSMGGAETLVKDYLLNIDKTKFDVTVVCFENYNSPWDNVLAENNIKVVYVNDLLTFGKKQNIFCRVINRLQRQRVLNHVIKEINPDVLHYHLPLGKYVLKMNLPKDTRLVYTQHFTVQRLLQEFPQEIIYMKSLIKKHQITILALQEVMRDELYKIFKNENIYILENGIDISRFMKKYDREKIRKELNIANNFFVISQVGRFSREKNQRFSIEIFEKVLKKRKKSHLLLIGDGPEKAKIIDLVKQKDLEEYVTILSNRKDIPELLACVDCIVHPAISEGLCIALIEAQAAGKKCIASDNVPQKTKISNLLIYMSLNDNKDKWVEEIFKPLLEKIEYYNLEKWNIKNTVRTLENIYEGKYND